MHFPGAQNVLDNLKEDDVLTCAKLKLRCTARKERWVSPAGAHVDPPEKHAVGELVWVPNSEVRDPAYKAFFTAAVQEFEEDATYEQLINDKWPADVLMVYGKGMLRVVSVVTHGC